jgi:hypothetical protein
MSKKNKIFKSSCHLSVFSWEWCEARYNERADKKIVLEEHFRTCECSNKNFRNCFEKSKVSPKQESFIQIKRASDKKI